MKLIEKSNPSISIVRQCQLLGVSRGSYYYEPVPVSDRESLLICGKIDEIYTELPFYGSPRITKELRRRNIIVNHKMVERLMREMGLQALFPRKNTSRPNPAHPVFPYLLRHLKAIRPNQIWGTDVTFIRGNGLWFYLVAVIDWYSRFVLAWRLSPMMTSDFCVSAIEDAFQTGIPEIHNSDQVSQFTSFEYIAKLKEHLEMKISMDGRGRCFDNIFTERLWRTVKYEEVYLQEYQSLDEARKSLASYFHFYNKRRLHQSLGYQTPAEVYFADRNSKVENTPILVHNSV